ncbi:MAG TPA: LysR family transcriptional regulator [Candidatus Ornithoclostridium excrementipullorum]|nr:LysR family transcriptional regulator [Candidatus Ornithoclostridium excrementipullorum]
MYNPQLETFIAAADAGSFSKAAEILYITPTAVIKQINLLERDLDLRLFERSFRGLTLTKAGQSLYNDAKYIIQYAKESVVRAKNAMQEEGSVIRIGTSLMTPCQYLLKLWPKIEKVRPDFRFRVVPFENTPENAREILANLGQNIDLVLGIFDDVMLGLRKCAALELSREPVCVAMSVNHRLANKKRLSYRDMYGETLMIMRRNWCGYIDELRDDLWSNHPQIATEDISFYDINAFNRCESGNNLLVAVKRWEGVHPLLKIVPVNWEHSVPYGILHSPEPSDTVMEFLEAVKQAISE